MANPFVLKLIQGLPPPLIRWFGRLQFRLPMLSKWIKSISSGATAVDGIIRYGVGAGLKFNATGGFPGYLLGTTEPEEQALLERLLRPGAVFYDLGANIGFFSTLAARIVGKSGQVYAFEPWPASAQAARRNAALNGFHHVAVYEVALSDGPGTAYLALGDGSALHRIADAGEIQVRVVALDEFVRDEKLRPPDVVMIDVEGAEIEVLIGMMEQIGEHTPHVLCEVHWIGERFASFVQQRLAPLGYEITTLEGVPPSTPNQRFHALLTPSENSRRRTAS